MWVGPKLNNRLRSDEYCKQHGAAGIARRAHTYGGTLRSLDRNEVLLLFFFSLHLTFHIIMHAPPSSCSKNVGIVYEEPAKNIPKEKISTTSTNSTRTYVCACTSTTLVGVVKLHGANRQRRLRTPLSIGEPTSVRADVNDARPLTGRSPTRRASAPCPPARSPAHISGQ